VTGVQGLDGSGLCLPRLGKIVIKKIRAYRWWLLWNQGKDGCSKDDKYNNNRIWGEIGSDQRS